MDTDLLKVSRFQMTIPSREAIESRVFSGPTGSQAQIHHDEITGIQLGTRLFYATSYQFTAILAYQHPAILVGD
jgi:hypothetical protein